MKLETFLTNLYKAYTSNNTYVNGAFGVVLKDKQLERYLTMNDYNKEHAETIKNRAANFPCFGFDCIGLIKALVWGWNGDAEKTYGGAIYESGEIEDMSLSKFFTTYCSNITYITTDTYPIHVGSLLWTSGHIAIYLGGGVAIEATRHGDAKIRFCHVKGMDCINKSFLPEREFDAFGDFKLLDSCKIWTWDITYNYMKTGDLELPTPPKTYSYLKVIDANGEVVCVDHSDLTEAIETLNLKYPIMILEELTTEKDWG